MPLSWGSGRIVVRTRVMSRMLNDAPPLRFAQKRRLGYSARMQRHDGRTFDQLRNIKVTRNFTQAPAGSVLWQQGTTMVLCTASVTPDVPPWFRLDKPGGW